MVGKGRAAPVLAAALGCALCYYGLGFAGGRYGAAAFAVVLFCCAGISLFRVLAESPALFAPDAESSRRVRLAHRLFLAFSAGMILGLVQAASPSQGPYPGLEPGTVAAVSGKLTEDPRAVPDGRGMGRIDLIYAENGQGTRTSAQGPLVVYFPEESVGRMKEFGRGCTVYLEGSYVVRDGSGALFRARSVHVTSAAPPLEQFRTGVRRKLTELADSAGGGAAWTGLSLALLFGIKDSLEGNLATSYRDAGCSHVLALSGMHLAIVSAMVVFLLKKPLGLRPAAVLGAIFVAAYVFVVGPQPSLVRAAIMYILGTLAVLGSLPRDPLNLLGMSFLIQIIADRASGTSLSFILSYLALFGILASGESLRRLCRGYLPDAALGPLAASVGAFIATAPVTAAWFGLLRPVGIPAGLVMVPLATAFMAGSALVLFLAGIFPPAGRIAGHVLAALYRIQEGIAGGAAALPGLRVPALPAAAAAIVLFILLLCLDRRVSRTRGRIAPFAQLS